MWLAHKLNAPDWPIKSSNHHTTVRSSSINVFSGGPPDERLRSNKRATLSRVPKRFPFIHVVLLRLNLLTQSPTLQPAHVSLSGALAPRLPWHLWVPHHCQFIRVRNPVPSCVEDFREDCKRDQVDGVSGFRTVNEKMDSYMIGNKTINKNIKFVQIK